MATTILETVSSVLHSITPQSIIPQRRPREQIEVIDVDQLDDSIYLPGPSNSNPGSGRVSPSRSQRRRVSPDAIVVISDSEDDDFEPEIIAMSSANSSGGSSRAPSRYISPPPRQSGTQHVPPVPRVPSEFASFTSLPMRRRPPPYPEQNTASIPLPPVTADPDAFDFDFDRLLSGSNSPRPSSSASGGSEHPNRHRARQDNSSGSAGSSRSGRMPVLGLGGGLITSAHSRSARERALREQHAQQRASGSAPRFRGRSGPTHGHFGVHFVGRRRVEFSPFDGIWVGTEDWRHHDMDDLVYHNGIMRHSGTRSLGRTSEPDYKPSYTHPDPAEPGFTFDFAPASPTEAEDNSLPDVSRRPDFPASSAEHPIVLDDDGEIVEVGPSGSGEAGPSAGSAVASTSAVENSPGSLTTLLVCSRCQAPLLLGEGASASALKMAAAGATAEEVEAERRGRRLWGLRCGHLIDGKCLDALSVPPGALEASEKRDVKGKGKGKAVDVVESEVEVEVSLGMDLKEEPVEENYRSRLRSSKTSTNIRQSGEESLSYKPKPRAKSKKDQTEEVYQWECPLSGCARVHTSIKVNGVWGPEKAKGEGAIALFV